MVQLGVDVPLQALIIRKSGTFALCSGPGSNATLRPVGQLPLSRSAENGPFQMARGTRLGVTRDW